MSDSDLFNVPTVPEQDQSGGDGLPTYDDLAQQHGPNSRFGRWREWIEKRAAERYNDLTPADLERRRQRGWGDGLDQQPGQAQGRPPPSRDLSLPTFSVYAPSTYSDGSSSQPLSIYSSNPSSYAQSSYPSQPVSMYSNAPSSYNSLPISMYSNVPSSYALGQPHLHPQLQLQTSFLQGMPSPFSHATYPPPPQTLIPEPLEPSHLKLYNFGSRFLPHTTSPIRCLLPLNNHHLLLIGHDDGLSVLDMFPSDWNEDNETEKGPSDAEAKVIWEGEGVHQMTILESESTGEGTPQGVVLVLVSTEDSSRESENMQVLRMYNLGSLISLAKYYATQKGARPLDLRSSGKGMQSSGRRHHHHRPPSSITKGLKNLVLDNGIASPQTPSSRHPEPQASYSSITESWASPGKSKGKAVGTPLRTDSVDSEWDVVNELPLRWATNYTPLASSGSRLQNSSVVLYDVWRNEGQRGPGGVLLAIGTKSSILLYEAPKGERAFRFTKEFYTPLPARNIAFIQQSVQDSMSRSPSDVFPRTTTLDNISHHRHMRVSSFGSNNRIYPTQLSLFVVFEKKAGTIRVADAAVGEVELYEDNWSAQQSMLMSAPSASGLSSRRSRASWDGRGFAKEKGVWVRPVRFDVPGAGGGRTAFTQMYLLTRGRQSHIIPHPLPARVSAVPPYRILYWMSTPTHVSVRMCDSDDLDEPPILQVMGFSEEGVEVQEVPLSQLSERKGKGRAQEPVRTQADVGGAAGLLVGGGSWDRPFFQGGLHRSYSTSSGDTYESSTVEDEDRERRLRSREGVYAWVRKGAEDYRIVWLGGGNEDDDFE